VVYAREPSVRRSAVAVEAGTTVLAIGGLPGAHAPSAWEWTFEAERYRESGDSAAALDLLAEARGRFPDDVGVMYSTACWEAVAGDTRAAIARLNAALELEPKVAKWAEGDTDLDSIRGLPGSPV
jgi:hypothetical protein